MQRLLFVLFLASAHVFGADIYTFTVPTGVNISAGGATVTGWGYSIQNESSSLWLVTTGLSAGTFQHATPESLFDFPDIAPGATITVPFDLGTGAGFYQITWDANAPAGFVNSGSFVLEAQWWSGDPLNGGSPISQAPSASQPYSARFSVIPEPATNVLVGSMVLLLSILAWARKSRYGPTPGCNIEEPFRLEAFSVVDIEKSPDAILRF